MKAWVKILLIIALVLLLLFGGCYIYFRYFALIRDKGGMENPDYTDACDIPPAETNSSDDN